MEDLVPPQIKDSCKLALPEGLKDLMSDITREVLRYQPKNLYQFITDYLSALLVTRDNLSVAACICNDVFDCGCQPELQHALSDLGLPEDEVKMAKDIIMKYIEKGPVNEGNLLMQLMKDTTIDKSMIPALQEAIRTAFLRHQAQNTTVYESSSDSEEDEMIAAAKHTLDLYKKTAPSEEMYEMMAEKIQKSYRAYGVRRHCGPKYHLPKEARTKFSDKITLVDPKSCPIISSFYDIAFPKTTYSEASISEPSSSEDFEIAMSSSMNKKRVTTISSTSLAGSLLNLPSYRPYSAHECDALSDLEEFPEREHAYIDYTVENPHISMVTEDKLFYNRESCKKISFSDSVVAEETKKMGLEVDNDSESVDADQQSSMEVESDVFYRPDMIKADTNYDGYVEIEPDENIQESDDDRRNKDLELLHINLQDLERNESTAKTKE